MPQKVITIDLEKTKQEIEQKIQSGSMTTQHLQWFMSLSRVQRDYAFTLIKPDPNETF